MRTVGDSPAMHHAEATYECMRDNPRAVRLGLATDGFSPVGLSRKSYSIWPVMVINYNVSSWGNTASCVWTKPHVDITRASILGYAMHEEGNVVKNLLQHIWGKMDTINHWRACVEFGMHPLRTKGVEGICRFFLEDVICRYGFVDLLSQEDDEDEDEDEDDLHEDIV
ncbi:hypothetical protein R1sor_007332 [Riccia sorocarpa]|uniref:Uncharacterized protein n=1 Tax=Riccia sorocarpa TaxID=122646 RepID=A0ABD3HSC6_9MARC